MNQVFAETLRRLRSAKGYSQQQLADRIIVNRSTIAKWEAGSRLPDVDMIYRLANALNMDVNTLLNAAWESEGTINIILVDDERVILSGGIPVLEQVFPDTVITGFSRPSDAAAFAAKNRVALELMCGGTLEIRSGKAGGTVVTLSIPEKL